MRHRTLWVALGLAEAKSQHDPLEAEALSRWAEGKRTLLEIGVAEGASALVREIDGSNREALARGSSCICRGIRSSTRG